MTDKDLGSLIVQVTENDDQRAFQALYRHFLPGMLSYVNTLLHDRQLSEEVVEDVFIKIWNSGKTLLTIYNISFYLYTAAKHTALNYLQRWQRSAFASLEEAGEVFSIQTPEAEHIQKENLLQIETAINTLPLKCRLIFRLITEEGLKYKEVAQLLSISPKTVEAHMTLAYGRIAESLEELLIEFPGVKKAGNS